jgi:hypothetical protein
MEPYKGSCLVERVDDNFLKEQVLKGMCHHVGEVKEVHIKLLVGFVGSFVRIKVKLNVNKKLSRFASITKDGKKEYYQVKYEKLPDFCGNCGMIGH